MDQRNLFGTNDRLSRAVEEAKRRQREAEGQAEPWSKVTVVLKDRQVVFLDGVALEIRARTGAAVARAEIIRALVDAVAESGLDLAQAASEAELRKLILERLG
jgi:hypothetical protein